MSWTEIAAPGTDPELLARAVVEVARRGSVPVARAALTRRTTEPRALLTEVLPRLDPTTRSVADRIADRWSALGVTAAVVGDPAYPLRLRRAWPEQAAPLVVAWRGPRPGVPDRPAVAIVGARRATPYGTGVASWLAEAAAAAGVVVVSGGAVGVDAAAHRAALDARGTTVVVLGCGHDVPYPQLHARPGGLFDRVLDAGGLLVGEALPGTPPRPPQVLARNRIVAALADAVVVVEGGPRSGALRTAAAAADLGIAVLAVPGDVRAPGSAAPHQLLAEGAACCRDPADLLAAVGASDGGVPAGPAAAGAESAGVLPPEALGVLTRCWPRPVPADELAAAAGVPTGRLLAALTRARIAGAVVETPEGVRLRRPPAAGR